ncbi:hypothetical protein [Myxococcus eversor]|uniref:hypothetical protein n=1 Tax=Myxococcus eversor TaxID=2709661 RepID=UPI0013D430E8|nr:hypothetical protein [Myxococcus eversor]
MNTPKSPWRRLKAELARANLIPSSVRDEFTALKQESFDFLMNIIERRDGTSRQLRNALLMASKMRGWGRARFTLTLPNLCEHEDIKVRTTALRILVLWLKQTRASPAERIEGYDERSFDEPINKALALGVDEGTAYLVRKHRDPPAE